MWERRRKREEEVEREGEEMELREREWEKKKERNKIERGRKRWREGEESGRIQRDGRREGCSEKGGGRDRGREAVSQTQEEAWLIFVHLSDFCSSSIKSVRFLLDLGGGTGHSGRSLTPVSVATDPV